MDGQAQAHFLEVEGLDDVIHGPGTQAGNPLLGAGGGGEEDDGNVAGAGVVAQTPAGGQAVAARHAHVHQDEVGLGRDRLVEGVVAIDADIGPTALALQVMGEHAAVGVHVVHDEDACPGQHVGLGC